MLPFLNALGMQYVIEGRSAMLWGKTDEIRTPCDIGPDHFDPVAKVTRPVTEEHVLADRQVGILRMLKWGLGYGVDMLVHPKDNCMICIPTSSWEPELEKALQELRDEAGQNKEDPSKVFLTENDIVTAWTLRCVVAAMETDPRRTREPRAESRPCLGNAFGWANVTSKPLNWLAHQIRRAINEQGTRAQHDAYYAKVLSSRLDLPIVIFGDGGMIQLGFSNWSKAGLFDLDFAPARVDTSKDASIPCIPLYVQENHGPIKLTNGFFIFGKDQKGNSLPAKSRDSGTRLRSSLPRICNFH